MKQFTDEQHKSLVAEAKKQSRKLIDINDKGYNAYRLCLNFTTSDYAKNSMLQSVMKSKPEWEGLKLEARICKNTWWREKLIFLAPKDVDVTLDNILEHCDFINFYNRSIPFLLGAKPVRRREYKSWIEYDLISPPILEKVESGKLPENIFNYFLSHQQLSTNNKMLLMVDSYLEGEIYKWEQKALNRALELFNQDPKEVMDRTVKHSKFHEIDLITVEEFERRFDEALV